MIISFNTETDQTTTLHQLLVATMKCKQTVDKSHVNKGIELVEKFSQYYFTSHILDHLKKITE